MTDVRWLRFAVVGLLLAPYAAVMAQDISTRDLVTGNYGKYATMLKLNELPDGYTAGRYVINNAPTSFESLIALSMGRNNPESLRRSQILQCLWSKGEVVKSLGRDFLVTYKVDADIQGVVGQDSSGTPVSPPKEPPLRINLVALDSIQGVTPYPELSKKDLLECWGVSTGEHSGYQPSISNLQTSTLSNLKQAGLGLMMYMSDYDDNLPYAQSTKAVWYVEFPYVKNVNVFKSYNPKGGEFRFNMGIAGVNGSSIPKPSEHVLLYEATPWADGRRCVVFCDGHGKLVSLAEWEALEKKLKIPGVKRETKPLPLNYGDKFDEILRAKASVQEGAMPAPSIK